MIRKLLFLPPTEADPLLRSAFLAAREICRRHARSFYFASHFLPVEKRYAAYAVYAFCRLIDDAVDQEEEATDRPAAERRSRLDAVLARFEATLSAIYASRMPAPSINAGEAALAMHAFAVTTRRYGIPDRPFRELAEGCRMDLTISRYATWADLEQYCYRVAGVVGLIMCPIFGLTDPRATAQAVQMGNAMQLTNILRDVREDWDRGRLYLPAEDLARFDYAERDVAGHVVDDRFRALMQFQIDRARKLYRDGSAGLCHLANDGSRLTAAAMAVIYSGILSAIEHQGYDVYRSRAHLTGGEKILRLPKAWKLAGCDVGDVVPDVFGN